MKEATLEDVLIDLTMAGGDRASLVRTSECGSPPAVCVIMASSNAISVIGAQLRDVFAELGTTSQQDFNRHFDVRIDLGALFAIADSAPRGWSYGMLRFGKLDVMVALAVRELDRIAAICNAHGAPCSFEAGKAAPGYKIERTIQR
jgi:hypothetical protein